MPNSQLAIRHFSPSQLVPYALRLLPCALCLALASCTPQTPAPLPTVPPSTPAPTTVGPTPLPTRTMFEPGQLLPYVVQTGDTAPSIAAHFNTSVEKVLAANPELPPNATLPSGQAIRVPAYYLPLGGPTFKIIPDSEFVYGPAQKDFDVAAYLQAQPGYLRTLSAFAGDRQRSSADAIRYVAQQYSLNPKLLLALLEWRTHALTATDVPPEVSADPLDFAEAGSNFYLQLAWAADQLSIGYYGWRSGTLTSILFKDSYRTRPDMYQNAGTVGVQYLLAQMFPHDQFEAVAGPDGFAKTYHALWGDPWTSHPPDVIPANLAQPELALPFASNQEWSLTGGPHPGWGEDDKLPWAALDIGPPGATHCIVSDDWVRASAPGVIVRSGDSTVVLDLDGDGFEQTGWALFYFHVAERDRIAAGAHVQTGDLIGHPSCEGGTATGTHVHVARRYNGEWIPADGIAAGVVPFVLGGWTAERGDAPYRGRLTRLGAWVEACTCSTAANKIYWAK